MVQKMSKRQRRLILIGAAGVVLALAVTLVLTNLKPVYFRGPTELASSATSGEHVRIGGLVKVGSVARDAQGRLVFEVTDTAHSVAVRYNGDPPDLFRENQGVVVEARYGPDGVFEASRVLAKHDEKYMPKEVSEAIKRRGDWRGLSDAPAPPDKTGAGT
jgi:cytochrome c-type biogenesis protein CcmE